MVRAELSYNPYLLDTQITFNGNPPRINSLVEKYSGGKLQDWIDELPQVFYNEMNGYDFDLIFSGTELDFKELEKSLARAGISSDLVRLSHKGHIGSRTEKAHEINQLILWLDENPDERFDWVNFRKRNMEVFEEAYPFVVIGKTLASNSNSINDRLFDDIDISLDIVESVNELRKTDLNSTPILIALDKYSVSTITFNLKELLRRKDVEQAQLFFLINRDSEKVERLIRDLGVADPQIVSSLNDETILRYLEIYPVSERIHDAIKVFRKQVDELGRILDEENRLSVITNKDVHEKLGGLDDTLNVLKSTSDLFANRSRLDQPSALAGSKENLMYEIRHWRAKKTKIDGPETARQFAREYEDIIALHFDRFCQDIKSVFLATRAEIIAKTHEWYKHAQLDDNFAVEPPAESPSFEYTMPAIATSLMKMKSERYVMPKEDLFESFGKLFGGVADSTPQEPVLETVFYCEKWRNYAESAVEPIANSIIDGAYVALCEVFDQQAKAYLDHIHVLIQSTSSERERVSAQLSEDEQKLQADNDWHTMFCDKLRAIERL